MMLADPRALAVKMVDLHAEDALGVALRQSVVLLEAGQLAQAVEMVRVAALISENQHADGSRLLQA
jgi:hypothetical protein